MVAVFLIFAGEPGEVTEAVLVVGQSLSSGIFGKLCLASQFWAEPPEMIIVSGIQYLGGGFLKCFVNLIFEARGTV